MEVFIKDKRMKTFRILCMVSLFLVSVTSLAQSKAGEKDREQWVNLCYEIAKPILSNMSEGKLQQEMQPILSPIWDGRDAKVTYLEAFGRLMAGISPWLAISKEDCSASEFKKKEELLKWALKSYKNAVDPQSNDYLLWTGHSQILVDAAYLAQSFMRAPEALWDPLDDLTKERYIAAFKKLRGVRPSYNNWLLFRGIVESFLASVGEPIDGFAVDLSIRKINEWYVGDGLYSDGTVFSLDYYNSYVIHPMFVEMVETLNKSGIGTSISLDLLLRRMLRYNHHLERIISPTGTYPPIGRSVTYRLAAFQPLALAVWKYTLPKDISYGQVRAALSLVMHNMFSIPGNFNSKGFLDLGFVGQDPKLADYYTNNGSLYMTSLIFMPLGLSNKHEFWTAEPQDWTQKKAWKGESITKDYGESIIK